MNYRFWRASRILNALQSGFVSLLRLWSIPIVLLLSVASGYTTYYGMSRFITDWIALIITIAVQSIIIICTLEIATMHWKANRSRYFIVMISLIASVCVSVSFSYFKFYEISQTQSIRIEKLSVLQRNVDDYLNRVNRTKTELIREQRDKTENSERDTSLAYMGKHPDMTPEYKNLVGRGAFWRHFNSISKTERERLGNLENAFVSLDQSIGELRQMTREFDLNSVTSAQDYDAIVAQFSLVQKSFDELVTGQGRISVNAPLLPPYEKFIEILAPSLSMWKGFSLFAFVCALMVDFFTIILSYRLEANAPGALTESEQELAYHCLRQFKEFKINANDELEIVIEKNRIETARRYPDWMRLYGAAFLLNRGFLRKVDNKAVEFAPNLYPIIADVMTKQAEKTVVGPSEPLANATAEPESQKFDQTVKRMLRE